MTEHALRNADRLLTELVELVETARAVPMSGSCVLPREQVLDVLDELREVMPPEMDEARRVIAERDGLLQQAREAAGTARAEAESVVAEARERSGAQADAIIADAEHRARELVGEAEVRAHELGEHGAAEHGRLVSATSVHRSAQQAAAQLRADAEAYQAEVRGAADRHAAQLHGEAERYAAGVRSTPRRSPTARSPTSSTCCGGPPRPPSRAGGHWPLGALIRRPRRWPRPWPVRRRFRAEPAAELGLPRPQLRSSPLFACPRTSHRKCTSTRVPRLSSRSGTSAVGPDRCAAIGVLLPHLRVSDSISSGCRQAPRSGSTCVWSRSPKACSSRGR